MSKTQGFWQWTRDKDLGNGHHPRARRTALGRDFSRSRGRSRQGKWTVQQGRSSRFQKGQQEKGYDIGLYKQAITFFFSNIPDDWSYFEIWRTFGKYGRVIAIYNLGRRSKNGSRFGFVRFLNVRNAKELKINLDQIRVESCEIWVNLAKYPKEREANTKKLRKDISLLL